MTKLSQAQPRQPGEGDMDLVSVKVDQHSENRLDLCFIHDRSILDKSGAALPLITVKYGTYTGLCAGQLV